MTNGINIGSTGKAVPGTFKDVSKLTLVLVREAVPQRERTAQERVLEDALLDYVIHGGVARDIATRVAGELARLQ
jgi:hypothetical protein